MTTKAQWVQIAIQGAIDADAAIVATGRRVTATIAETRAEARPFRDAASAAWGRWVASKNDRSGIAHLDEYHALDARASALEDAADLLDEVALELACELLKLRQARTVSHVQGQLFGPPSPSKVAA